jgi:hypothetical protein
MASALLRHYVRLLNWVVKRLESIVEFPEDYVLASELVGIQKLYLDGKNTLEIANYYSAIHPDLIDLVVKKIAAQNGCLSYADRFLATLF